MQKSLRITNELKQVARLTAFIARAMKGSTAPQTVGMQFRLAVEEAVVNCILYAYPEETKGEIEIRIDCCRESLTAVISDAGRPFDPTAGKDPDVNLPLAERPVGGLGRFLVKKLMSRVYYERDNNNRNVLTIIRELNEDA
ncbi:MAG: ATP-binding protein [Tannerellaceae bacterium]|jgi:serine/threonine-protein kinase RsbW|nr:ATP-binding protein [Tannerellaceae bacterium]